MSKPAEFPDLVVGLDCAMHKTGLALLKKQGYARGKLVYGVETTKTIEVSSKMKGEEAVIEMGFRILDKLSEFNINNLESGRLHFAVEIQKPHECDRMSVQAFAHLAAVPLALITTMNYCRQKCFMYAPVQWKKTTKKKLCTQRLYAREVLELTNPKLFSMKTPDILDAIGIARHHIDRLAYKERTGQL